MEAATSSDRLWGTRVRTWSRTKEGRLLPLCEEIFDASGVAVLVMPTRHARQRATDDSLRRSLAHLAETAGRMSRPSRFSFVTARVG